MATKKAEKPAADKKKVAPKKADAKKVTTKKAAPTPVKKAANPSAKKMVGAKTVTAHSFPASSRTIYNVPLNAIQANPGNPGNFREREVIPNLFEMGYRIFPSKDTAPDHCLWTMLNGAFGKPVQAALRAQAVQLIKEFETVADENPIIEMADSIENTALVHPVHFVIQKGRVGIESGMARAFAKAFQDASQGREPGIIEGEVDIDPDEKVMLARATVENIHVIVNQPIAVAQRYALMRKLGMTVEEIAKKVRRGEQTIRNYLDLASLPEDVQQRVAAKDMTMDIALDFCRAAREEEKPLEEVVQRWRDEQSEEAAGEIGDGALLGFGGGGGGGRGRGRGRKSKHAMLKWDKAFLVFKSVFEEKPDKDELAKLTKDQLVEQVVRVHAASMEALCKVLQIEEQEAISMVLSSQGDDILAAGDMGFGSGESGEAVGDEEE
jgi:ParB-like chromosome segregation protein Spo0J